MYVYNQVRSANVTLNLFFHIILRTGYRTLWNLNIFHVKENSGPFRFLPVILV